MHAIIPILIALVFLTSVKVVAIQTQIPTQNKKNPRPKNINRKVPANVVCSIVLYMSLIEANDTIDPTPKPVIAPRILK